MFCENCGAQIEDGSMFCPECGTRLNAEPAPAQPNYGGYTDLSGKLPEDGSTVVLSNYNYTDPQPNNGGPAPAQPNYGGYTAPAQPNYGGYTEPAQPNYGGYTAPAQPNYGGYTDPSQPNYAGYTAPQPNPYPPVYSGSSGSAAGADLYPYHPGSNPARKRSLPKE